MPWKHPPIIKIYEALGTVADGRIEMNGDSAKVFSSTGKKFYEVLYDPVANEIMCNDNSSYWQATLGYPAIAMLFKLGVLEYKPELARLLKGIVWKDLNTKIKNKDQAIAHVEFALDDTDRDHLHAYVAELDTQLKKLQLNLLGPRVRPPSGD
jgi:hypothetical protein